MMMTRKNSILGAALLAGSVLFGLGAQAQPAHQDNHRPAPPARNDRRPPPAAAPARPDARPNVRPDARPNVRPDTRPNMRPDVRPNVRPDVRPNVRPNMRPDLRPGSYGAPGHRRYYRPPVVYSGRPFGLMIGGLSIMLGGAMPYGSYPIDDWAYYNLPMPCCGQYWAQYGQSYLLISPDGVVLQAITP